MTATVFSSPRWGSPKRSQHHRRGLPAGPVGTLRSVRPRLWPESARGAALGQGAQMDRNRSRQTL
jgi:hypothetical protein